MKSEFSDLSFQCRSFLLKIKTEIILYRKDLEDWSFYKVALKPVDGTPAGSLSKTSKE